jgi:hypothetical protein
VVAVLVGRPAAVLGYQAAQKTLVDFDSMAAVLAHQAAQMLWSAALDALVAALVAALEAASGYQAAQMSSLVDSDSKVADQVERK